MWLRKKFSPKKKKASLSDEPPEELLNEVSLVKEGRLARDLEIEKATPRHTDGVPYLPFHELKEKYPFTTGGNNLAGEGVYGKVYFSGHFVIKKFAADYLCTALIQELNMVASFSHPCILKPLYWSYEGEHGYFVMEKGRPLKDIYISKGKKASNEQLIRIMGDTLSGVHFLNKLGIAHGDIKPDNMVFHNGKVKLIDMGLAQKAELHTDGNYYMTRPCYAPIYCDMEFSSDQYNNINAEIYALFTSYIGIIEGREPELGELYTYVLPPKYAHLEPYFEKARAFQNERPTISSLFSKFSQEFSQELGVRPNMGTHFYQFVEAPEEKEQVGNMMQIMIKAAYILQLKAETLFLALHLVHRTYAYVSKIYVKFDKLLFVFGAAALHLAIVVVQSERQSFESWQKIFPGMTDLFDFRDMIFSIMKATNGIITTLTYWDYAESQKDLLPLLHDMVNWKYNSKYIRSMHTVSINKCIRVDQFVPKTALGSFGGDFKTPTQKTTIVDGVKPCILDLKPNSSLIEDYWRRYKFEPEIDKNGEQNSNKDMLMIFFLNVLMHNRAALDELKVTTSKEICAFLFDLILSEQDGEIALFIMNVLCRFDLDRTEEVLQLGKNPFTVTNADLLPLEEKEEYAPPPEEEESEEEYASPPEEEDSN